MQNKNNKSGFSLVELMVVVAIIGILATIAIPNFLKFQAKAKQSNAKSELAGVYTAEKAFFVENSTYHSVLPYIGYVAEGMTLDASNCPTGPAANVQRSYTTGMSAGIVANQNGNVSQCGNATGANVSWYAATTGAPGALSAAATSSAANFTAESRAQLTSSARVDIWQIDDNRVLANTQQGL